MSIFDRNRPRKRVSISFDPAKGLVKSEFLASCDINRIVKKYTPGFERHLSVVQNFLNSVLPSMTFADTTLMPDYQAACDFVIRSREAFESLDPRVRDRFSNDPARFLDFCSDPSNKDEAVKLGLCIVPQAPVEPPVDSSASKV